MEFLAKVWDFLRGKKTFIIGALMIILGLLNNDDKLLLEGFGLLTLRHAIK